MSIVHQGHKFIRPKAIHDPEIVDELAKDYIYFSCIQFINSVCSAFFPLPILSYNSNSYPARSKLLRYNGILQC